MFRSLLQLLTLSLITGAVLTLLIYLPLPLTCAGFILWSAAARCRFSPRSLLRNRSSR